MKQIENGSMKQIEVVAAVICDKNRIFATQRGYGAFKDGWEFPGGKMEPGETPEQALKREIHEELDTIIEVDRLITTVDANYPEFHLTMHCYFCHVVAGKLTLLEHESAKWLKWAELDSVDWLPADRMLIKHPSFTKIEIEKEEMLVADSINENKSSDISEDMVYNDIM